MLPKIVQANLAIIRGLWMMSPPARLIIRSLTHSLNMGHSPKVDRDLFWSWFVLVALRMINGGSE